MIDQIIAEPKIVLMPKAKEVKLSSLENEVGVPVHFSEPAKPINQFDRPPVLPRLAVITAVYKQGTNYQVTYRSNKGVIGSCYFPNEHVMRRLTGTIGQELVKKYEESVMAKLYNNLSYVGQIGCDPEIFVEGKNGILPAFDFLGSKKDPTRTSGIQQDPGGKGAYWDGFQAEFETYPHGCLAWNVDSVQNGLATVLKAAKKLDPTAKLSTRTVFEVPMQLLQDSKEEYVTFGCMPSKNAYGLEGLVVPARELTARSAGGHIHFGIGKRTDEKMTEIVKSLDAILGIACVSLFENFDNPIRRQFYGLPGEYRTPPHGMEYRTLSNAWIFHPLIMNIVFDLSRKCVAFGDRGLLKHFKGEEKETIEVIRNCDVTGARAIMDRNKGLIEQMIKACGGHYYDHVAQVWNVFRNGMEVAIKDPNDIAGNWNLGGGWCSHSDGNGKNLRLSVDLLMAGKKV